MNTLNTQNYQKGSGGDGSEIIFKLIFVPKAQRTLKEHRSGRKGVKL